MAPCCVGMAMPQSPSSASLDGPARCQAICNSGIRITAGAVFAGILIRRLRLPQTLEFASDQF